MGLDMYAYAVGSHPENTDNSISKHAAKEDIAYWRKFNALHGYMEDLYKARGGTKSFNCIPLRLSLADLGSLENALDNNTLEPRSGFFWGTPDIYPEDIESARMFLDKARAAIADGFEVYYDSWW